MDLIFQLAAILIEVLADEVWPRQGDAPAEWLAHLLYAWTYIAG